MKRMLLYLAGLAVLLPIAMLALYALFSRWPWPDLLPSRLTLDALASVFQGNALRVLRGSIGYSLLSALVATLVAAPGAMALAWHSFRGKRLVRALLLAPVLLPSTAYFVGLQAFFTRAGLGDTVLAVLLGHVIVILPYGVWTLTDVLGQMGKGLEEQARTLGASGPAALWHITLPQLLPALAAVTGLGFVISFGQYFLTLMLGAAGYAPSPCWWCPISKGTTGNFPPPIPWPSWPFAPGYTACLAAFCKNITGSRSPWGKEPYDHIGIGRAYPGIR